MTFARDGFLRLPHDPRVAAWSQAARTAAEHILAANPARRHGGTWFVGVDALPNGPDGSIGGVPLRGPWVDLVATPNQWHKAQLSVVYPGYPRQDAEETDAAHRFRLLRDAAHLDGLLPEGPDNRRHLREPHAFVLGLPLNEVVASPLVVWKGSHRIISDAFARVFADAPAARWGDIDVTSAYQEARRQVFATCDRVELPASPGCSTLLDRRLIHGVAPWGDAPPVPAGRMIAYFRPLLDDPADWLGA